MTRIKIEDTFTNVYYLCVSSDKPRKPSLISATGQSHALSNLFGDKAAELIFAAEDADPTLDGDRKFLASVRRLGGGSIKSAELYMK